MIENIAIYSDYECVRACCFFFIFFFSDRQCYSEFIHTEHKMRNAKIIFILSFALAFDFGFELEMIFESAKSLTKRCWFDPNSIFNIPDISDADKVIDCMVIIICGN